MTTMEMRCYECRVGRHEYCLDVGCFCLRCMTNDKELDPIRFPITLAWLSTCSLSS